MVGILLFSILKRLVTPGDNLSPIISLMSPKEFFILVSCPVGVLLMASAIPSQFSWMMLSITATFSMSVPVSRIFFWASVTSKPFFVIAS